MSTDQNDQYIVTISIQYFVYFGVLGVYLPFFNLYCYHLGFNGIQIGAISSLRSVVLVVFSIGWSLAADRFQKHKSIYVLCNWLSTGVWAAYFFGDSFWALFFITGCYGFFSIHLAALGYGSLFIGFAWALASIAEIMVMINSKWIFKYLAYEKALIISFMVATIRWILISYVHSPIAVLSLQLLHAMTYGMFHMASVLYIDILSPNETKTLGQAINNATTYGLGLMVGFFLSGILYEQFSAAVGFITSGFIALFSCIIFTVYRVINSRTQSVN